MADEAVFLRLMVLIQGRAHGVALPAGRIGRRVPVKIISRDARGFLV